MKRFVFMFRIYERHIREQRALRRMQCRRTHVAHLNNETQRRLLKQLERERRQKFQEEICFERTLIDRFFFKFDDEFILFFNSE